MKKLLAYLQPLFNYKEDAKRFHWWFYLFWDPCYVRNLHCVKELHWLNWVETRSLIKTMNKYLFKYDAESEITHNTVFVLLSTVIENEEYMYSDTEGEIIHTSSSPRTGAA